jgi:hypothetical protein
MYHLTEAGLREGCWGGCVTVYARGYSFSESTKTSQLLENGGAKTTSCTKYTQVPMDALQSCLSKRRPISS